MKFVNCQAVLMLRRLTVAVCIVDYIPVYQRIFCFGKHFHWIAVKDGNICILSRLQTAHAVVCPADFCRIDGNGTESLFNAESFAGG